MLRKLKYIILVVFVILLPMFLVDILGQGAPYFCKLICPVGTLEGGIPLVLLNHSMRGAIGWLYTWKNVILIITIVLSVIIYRPFCKYLCPSGTLLGALPLLSANPLLRSQIGGLFFWKLGILLLILFLSVKVYRPFCQYLCPLGAIYGWFNRFSLLQIHWEKGLCTSCNACERACPLSLSVQEISCSSECIRCGQCVKACPANCLHFTAKGGALQKTEPSKTG